MLKHPCSREKCFVFNFSPANEVLSFMSMRKKENDYS